ncbi:hypothetical protein Tco_0033702 [Tanacetum coccineum]
MALHWSGVGAAPLMSQRQDETSKPLSYTVWMVGPYRVEDATWGRNDDPVTSGITGWTKADQSRIVQVFTISHSMEARRSNGRIQMVDDSPCLLDLNRSKAKSFEGCRSSVRMTMHEVVHEMVTGECHEPNSEGSGSAWKAYINARVAGLFMLVMLEYPNGECHEPNSEGSGSTWKAYINARVAGLFLLVLLEYPNGVGFVAWLGPIEFISECPFNREGGEFKAKSLKDVVVGANDLLGGHA